MNCTSHKEIHKCWNRRFAQFNAHMIFFTRKYHWMSSFLIYSPPQFSINDTWCLCAWHSWIKHNLCTVFRRSLSSTSRQYSPLLLTLTGVKLSVPTWVPSKIVYRPLCKIWPSDLSVLWLGTEGQNVNKKEWTKFGHGLINNRLTEGKNPTTHCERHNLYTRFRSTQNWKN